MEGEDRKPDEETEEDPNVDALVFEQSNDLMNEGHEQDFQCINPQNRSGHIVYTCKGSDAQGMWEGERRFNEFYKLHNKLEERWPGIPIPNLPPKKAIGNKDIKFINERRFYLERFMKKVSVFEFLLNSQEFLIFSRPSGDVDKMLSNLPKSSSVDIVEKYREQLKIEDHLYDPIAKDKLDNQCKEFQHFSKQMVPVLKAMVKSISSFMVNKSQSIQDYKGFLSMLDKYEELNLANYVEGDEHSMVFGNPTSATDKEAVNSMCDNLKNPYFNVYHWCKGELFDIEAVNQAIAMKDKISDKVNKSEKKKKST
mmetsp:Transcript_39706/g.60850  ORF Transcript_39706/g.60850 Transcript_39706/m.60850 type:complete len:311 (+) Transcript_39706:22-954(+)